jgi:hypothetical protein
VVGQLRFQIEIRLSSTDTGYNIDGGRDNVVKGIILNPGAQRALVQSMCAWLDACGGCPTGVWLAGPFVVGWRANTPLLWLAVTNDFLGSNIGLIRKLPYAFPPAAREVRTSSMHKLDARLSSIANA